MRLPVAIGTHKTIGPAPFDKHRVALLLGPVSLVEVDFAETLLKLHRVARHRQTLPKTICSVFVLGAKPRLTQERNQKRTRSPADGPNADHDRARRMISAPPRPISSAPSAPKKAKAPRSSCPPATPSRLTCCLPRSPRKSRPTRTPLS